jgi:glycosyltransferase involved in cell wall biosynthesis
MILRFRQRVGRSLVGLGLIGLGASSTLFAVERRTRHRALRMAQAAPYDRPEIVSDIRLSVVVPAYFEGERIGSTVARLRVALADIADTGGVEIIVVVDGSTDETGEVARAAGADDVIELPVNRGKGAAVREGMMRAKGRSVVFVDADLAYPPEQIHALLDMVEKGYDMVVGSRRHVETNTLVRARRLREVSGRVFNLFTYAVLLGQYRDTQCGLKAFRADAARALFSRTRIDRFAMDVELFFLAERLGLSLAEVPVTLSNTATSTVSVGRDARQMLTDLAHIRRYAIGGHYGEARPPGSPLEEA